MIGAGALGLAALFPIQSLGRGRARGWRVRRSSVELDSWTRTAGRSHRTVSNKTVCSPCSQKATSTTRMRADLVIQYDPSKDFRLARAAAGPGRQPRGLFEGLHARRLSGRAVRSPVPGTLLCPCHQSTFNVYDGARPVFRAGRGVVAATAARARQRRESHSTGPFSGPCRSRVLESEVAVGRRRAVSLVDRLARWFDNRLGLAKMAARCKIFPNQWSFLLGRESLYSFVVLLVTGIFLTFFYSASTNPTTYQGTYTPSGRGGLAGVRVRAEPELQSVRAGLVMRQMHHWAALVFVAIIVHMCRVFFTGAFRRPRAELDDRAHADAACHREWLCRLLTSR